MAYLPAGSFYTNGGITYQVVSDPSVPSGVRYVPYSGSTGSSPIYTQSGATVTASSPTITQSPFHGTTTTPTTTTTQTQIKPAATPVPIAPTIPKLTATPTSLQPPTSTGTAPTGSFPTMGQTPSGVDLLSQYQAAMPKLPSMADAYGAAGYQQVNPSFITPNLISGRPQDYYTNLQQGLVDQLRQQYFGPLGVAQKAASGESAGGRLDSGVGSQILAETVTRPFADEFTKIGLGVAQQQMDEAAHVQEYNATAQSNAQQFNATMAQRASEFNAGEFDNYQKNLASLRQGDQSAQIQLQQIAAQAASAEAGRLSQQAIAQLDSNIRAWEAALTDYRKEQELAQDLYLKQAQMQQDALLKQQELANQLYATQTQNALNAQKNTLQSQANAIQYLGTPLKDATGGQSSLANQLAGSFTL